MPPLHAEEGPSGVEWVGWRILYVVEGGKFFNSRDKLGTPLLPKPWEAALDRLPAFKKQNNSRFF